MGRGGLPVFVLLDGGSSIEKIIYEQKLHICPVDSIQTIKFLHYGLNFFFQCSQFYVHVCLSVFNNLQAKDLWKDNGVVIMAVRRPG